MSKELRQLLKSAGVSDEYLDDAMRDDMDQTIQDRELMRAEKATRPGVRTFRNLLYRMATGQVGEAPIPNVSGQMTNRANERIRQEALDEAEAQREEKAIADRYARIESVRDSLDKPTTAGRAKAQEQSLSIASSIRNEGYKRAVKSADVISANADERKKGQLNALKEQLATIDKLNNIAEGKANKDTPLETRAMKIANEIVSANDSNFGGSKEQKDIYDYINKHGGIRSTEEAKVLQTKILEQFRNVNNNQNLQLDQLEGAQAELNAGLSNLIDSANAGNDPWLKSDPTRLTAEDQLILDTIGEPGTPGYARLIAERERLASQLTNVMPKVEEAILQVSRERLGDPTFSGTADQAGRLLAEKNVPAFEIKQQQDYDAMTKYYNKLLTAPPEMQNIYLSQPRVQTFMNDNGYADDNISGLQHLRDMSSLRMFPTAAGQANLRNQLNQRVSAILGRPLLPDLTPSAAGSQGGTSAIKTGTPTGQNPQDVTEEEETN